MLHEDALWAVCPWQAFDNHQIIGNECLFSCYPPDGSCLKCSCSCQDDMMIVPAMLSNPYSTLKDVVGLVFRELLEHHGFPKECQLPPVRMACCQFIACLSNLLQDTESVEQKCCIAERPRIYAHVPQDVHSRPGLCKAPQAVRLSSHILYCSFCLAIRRVLVRPCHPHFTAQPHHCTDLLRRPEYLSNCPLRVHGVVLEGEFDDLLCDSFETRSALCGHWHNVNCLRLRGCHH